MSFAYGWTWLCPDRSYGDLPKSEGCELDPFTGRVEVANHGEGKQRSPLDQRSESGELRFAEPAFEAAALGKIGPALLGKMRPGRLRDCAHNSADLA